MQVRNYEPCRFVDLIEYHGSTLDPSEIFIVSKMTSVTEVAKRGAGKVLASFHEIPVNLNKIGLILFSGLNPAAGAVEEGIDVTNKAMSGVIDVGNLRSFWSILEEHR